MRATLTAGALALGLAAPVRADVWTVDPGGGGDFTDLQEAVDFASSGDVLVVETGGYGWVTVAGKGLAVVAAVGAVPATQRLVVRDLPAGEQVFLAGVGAEALELVDDLGPVRVQGCTVAGATTYNAVEVTSCADVVFTACSVTGRPGPPNDFIGGDGGTAMQVLWSTVAAYDSTFTGGPGGYGKVLDCMIGASGGIGGFGVTVNGSFLFAMGGAIRGGQGGTAGCCEFVSSDAGPGGTALLVDAQSSARVSGTPYQGGPGGDPPCIGNPVGPAGTDLLGSGGLIDTGVLPRGLVATALEPSGATQAVRVIGAPGDRVHVLQAGLPDFTDGGVPTGIWTLFLPVRRPVELGTIDATGVLDARLTVPWIPPSYGARVLYRQVLVLDAAGAAVLGAPVATAVLAP